MRNQCPYIVPVHLLHSEVCVRSLAVHKWRHLESSYSGNVDLASFQTAVTDVAHRVVCIPVVPGVLASLDCCVLLRNSVA